MGLQGVPFEKRSIINAIHGNKGIIADAARELGCERKTIYDWMDKDEEVAQAVKDARETANKDYLEQIERLKPKVVDSARNLVAENNVPTTLFFLKSLFGLTEYQKATPTTQIFVKNYGSDSEQILSQGVPTPDTESP